MPATDSFLRSLQAQFTAFMQWFNDQMAAALAPANSGPEITYLNGVSAPNTEGAVRLQFFDDEIYPANKALIEAYWKVNPAGGALGPNFFIHDALVPFQLNQEQVNRSSTNCSAADFDWRQHRAYDSGYDAKGEWQTGDMLPGTSAYNEPTLAGVRAAIEAVIKGIKSTAQGPAFEEVLAAIEAANQKGGKGG